MSRATQQAMRSRRGATHAAPPRPRIEEKLAATAVLVALWLPSVRGAAAPPPPPEPFVVNAYTTGTQILPAAAALGDGRYVVAWSSAGQDGFGLGVFARIFGADGTPAGADFQVNEFTSGYQLSPSIAALGEGFVVAWQSGPTLFCCTQDGSGFGVFARVFDGAGEPVGAELQANLYTLDNQANPSVAAAGPGFLVVWDSNDQDIDGVGVFGRLFDGTGQPATGELAIPDLTDGDQLAPAAVGLDGGGFVVAWRDTAGVDQPVEVRGRAFDPAGQPAGASAVLSSTAPVERRRPLLAGAASGHVLALWSERGADGDDFAVLARPLDAGAPAGGLAQVNTFTLNRQFATGTAAAAGGFVVVWDSLNQDGSSESVYGRRIDAQAAPLGPEFRVHAYTTGEQSQGVVAGLPDGSFVVAWTSAGDGDEYGILAARFPPDHASAECGDADAGGDVTARDALLSLAAATGVRACPLDRCDADGDGALASDDALAILRAAVGLEVELRCPLP